MKDVNGTGFQLIFGPGDWSAVLATGGEGLAWEADPAGLTLAPVIRSFPPRRNAPRLTPADRRGADADCYGNWFRIDAAARGLSAWREGQAARGIWSVAALEQPGTAPEAGGFGDLAPPPERFAGMRLCGLAVTSRNYLLVGTLNPGGLLVFDLHAGGGPVFTPWPAALDLQVFDMARAEGGGAWILDRGTDTRPARLWRLDDRLRLAPLGGTLDLPGAVADFAPEGQLPTQPPPCSLPAGLDLSLPGSGLPGARDAVAIAGLPDDTVLLLDATPGLPSRLLRFGPSGLLGGAVLDAALLDAFETPPPAMRGHDMAFVASEEAAPGQIRGTLTLVDDQGDQAFRFELACDAAAPGLIPGPRLELALIADYLPLRRFGGAALVAAGDAVFYDIDERWMPVAADPRRRREALGMTGAIRFDAGTPGTAWHRVILDAAIPAGAAVTVELRAADATADLDRAAWETLPRPYRRGDGPELPFWDPFPGSDPARGTGSWETLVQAAEGRYLDLRLTLSGDGRAAPRLRALRLYAPRFSYLDRYLPAIYRADAVSAGFLDRFLANVEGLFTTLEARVETAHGFIDTRIAPESGLDWLAGWLGAEPGTDWDATRRRLLIDHAELLFRWRGTPAGLKAMIDLATDPCPDAGLFAGLAAGRPADPESAQRGVRLSGAHARRIEGGPRPDPLPALAGWTPALGSAPLHAAFADFALARNATDAAGLGDLWGRAGITSAADIRLSALLPANAAEAADWRAFTAGPLGFAYAPATAADAAAWRGFLARRYGDPARMAAAQGIAAPAAGFAAVTLPDALPAGGAALADWIDFVSGVLPVAQAAHRFTVLAPVSPGETVQAREDRLARITRVVTRERPAHTAFEVRPFWALFQAGIARLGIDTTLGPGARFAAIELGIGALSEGFIGYGHPLAVRDRWVTGRDATGKGQL